MLTITSLFVTKRTFKKELGQLKGEQKWKILLLIQSLVNIQVSYPTQMAYVQSFILTAIIQKLCSTPFSTALTDLKFLKVIILTFNRGCNNYLKDKVTSQMKKIS